MDGMRSERISTRPTIHVMKLTALGLLRIKDVTGFTSRNDFSEPAVARALCPQARWVR